jgi:hypothetical protein
MEIIIARYPEQIFYLTELKIICGLPIDLDEIDRLPHREFIKDWMQTVAHPQCPQLIPVNQRKSLIIYDPIGYVNLNGLDNRRTLQFLYMTGRLLRVQPKRIQEIEDHFQRDLERVGDFCVANPTL